MAVAKSSSASSLTKQVLIREVWANNLYSEFVLMLGFTRSFPVISFDTEFPGSVFGEYNPAAHPSEFYARLKQNVDATDVIQVGFTLSNSKGELPEYQDDQPMVWQFNFKDFNVARGDTHNPEAIQLLRNHGIDFDKTARDGIDSAEFAKLLLDSRMVGGDSRWLTWIGFHNAYDLGYLIKMLLGKKELPSSPAQFLMLVRHYIGGAVYDIKSIPEKCTSRLYGGLEGIAKRLQVKRVAGVCHQAGSDSLLTMQVFMAVTERFFRGRGTSQDFHHTFGGVLCGLEGVVVFPPPPPVPIFVGPPPPHKRCIHYPPPPPPVVLQSCHLQPCIQVPGPVILRRCLPPHPTFISYPPPVIL